MRMPRSRRAGRWAALASALVVAAVGCGGDGDADPATAGEATTAGDDGSGGEALAGDVTVLAAASLADAFAEVEAAFEGANPGVDVDVSYDGSSALRDQIVAGVPADVFASASGPVMDDVVDAGAVAGEPAPFATNLLEIAVPAGNPAGVEGLDAFGDGELLVGLCAEEVPCGRFGREALANDGVTPAPDTDEPDVRSLLDKVASGELDAGLVYRTDVLSAGDDVEGIEIPDDLNVEATYPIAALAEGDDPDAAAAFVAFVLGDEGRAVLASYGFGPP
jgi:molybdate transport system substrate-binding protein